MAYVRQTPEAPASPELKDLYKKISDSFGFVPNHFQALGRLPAVIKGHLELGEAILQNGELSTAIKEEIGLVVSSVNASSYCISAHMQVLSNLGVDPAIGEALTSDYTSAPVGAKEKALFQFVHKLTRQQDEIEQADVEAVFSAGWNEAQLLEAVLATAWFNFINRISLGLGLVSDF